MRRALTAAAAVLGLLAAASPASAATGTLSDMSDPGAFPYRTWALSLPTTSRIDPDEVQVTENGKPVRDLVVTDPSDQGERRLGTVLVIDASASMHDDAIAGAMEAARAFAERRRPDQALGVVFFNGETRVALTPTTDAREIDEALAKEPDLARGTHINDGAAAGLNLLREANINAGSLVLLSDGDDTGSKLTHEQTVAAARRDRVRIFTVALESNVSSPRERARLADATGGTAATADSGASLRRTFAALSARLGGEYLVSYESTQPVGTQVNVRVDVPGGDTAATEYKAPPPATGVAPGSLADKTFWGSAAGLSVVVGLFGLLVAFGVGILFRPAPPPTTAERIAAYSPLDHVPAITERRNRASGAVVAAFERAFKASDRWERWVEQVDIARIERKPTELVLWALGTFAGSLVLAVGIGSPVPLILGVIVPAAVRQIVSFRAGRQRKLFAEQLADNLQVFASALRAGHSFTGALGTVVDDAPDPTRREFTRALADERLGVPIDDALTRVGQRMRSGEMGQVAMIAALQQETGGNTAEVLDRVVDNVRERQDLRRLVKTLTAQGRISQFVVTALPIAIALLISVLSPGYLTPLLESGPGRIALVIAAVMTAAGSFAIRKIVDIKV